MTTATANSATATTPTTATPTIATTSATAAAFLTRSACRRRIRSKGSNSSTAHRPCVADYMAEQRQEV